MRAMSDRATCGGDPLHPLRRLRGQVGPPLPVHGAVCRQVSESWRSLLDLCVCVFSSGVLIFCVFFRGVVCVSRAR